MTALAIYDMDKTVTRRPTYGAFLVHAALRLGPWRLLLAPVLLVPLATYALRLIDRGRLKEASYRILVGAVAPARLEPVVESFAERQIASNILPGARERLAERKLVEKAKGIVMEQRKLSEDEAYGALRKMAMNQNLALAEVARQAPGGGPPLGEAQRYALHLQKRFGEGAECGASYSRLAAGHYPLDLGALSLLTSEALPANLDELLEWNNGWERAAGSADRWHLVVIGTEVGR